MTHTEIQSRILARLKSEGLMLSSKLTKAVAGLSASLPLRAITNHTLWTD